MSDTPLIIRLIMQIGDIPIEIAQRILGYMDALGYKVRRRLTVQKRFGDFDDFWTQRRFRDRLI